MKNSKGIKNKLMSSQMSWMTLRKKPTIESQIAQRERDYIPGQEITGMCEDNIADMPLKRQHCPKCNELIYAGCSRIHSRYYCNTRPDEKEWLLNGSKGFCLSCKKTMSPNVIEFHVKYLCGKHPITVQCFYCQNFYRDYNKMLRHMLCLHKKRHRYLDLMSILPQADPVTAKYKAPKVVRHFFNNTLCGEGKIICEKNGKADNFLQVREKTTYTCQYCSKSLNGIHAYQNHMNTKCESEQHYTCFFCCFKADFVYVVLEHMEDYHNQQFNTYDVIQANLTGIIPTVDIVGADVEVTFAKPELLEPNTRRLTEEERINALEKNVLPLSRTLNGHCSTNHKDKKRKVRTNVKLTIKKHKVYKSKLDNKTEKVSRSKCPKCSEIVHSTEKRIHAKYHCGKDPKENEWILKNGKALCLRCKKLKLSDLIDFHVKYACPTRKGRFIIQCFYCSRTFSEYRKLTSHMKAWHIKSHYYADLLTILPDPDTVTDEDSNKPILINHPSIHMPQNYDEAGNPVNVRFSITDDFYTCFDCEYKSIAGFKVIDHMQEVHSKNYNLYDLINAKMIATTAKIN